MRVSFFASVKLTIPLIVLIAATILVGAWCPQESQGGFEKVVEAFGQQTAERLRAGGITDIFHTPFFLFLIGMLTINMIACSFQRVFPKVRQLRHKMPFMGQKEIGKLPVNITIPLKSSAGKAQSVLCALLKRGGYTLQIQADDALTGEWGKWGRLAATITHIGLLSLMLGVTITSWTGFTGFKPVPLKEVMSFADSEHSKLWIGKLPDWKVRVDATRREDYESGDAKQWYSTLTVLDAGGKAVKTQEISVNNPLSYEGVDIYQSSWGLESIIVSFNGKLAKLPLRQMGNTNAAFMPLDETTILIFSVRGQDKPVRVFGKIPEWQGPKMLTEIPKGQKRSFGEVLVGFEDLVPVTGLQYKSDPGLPITYFAFGWIMCGVLLAAFPHRQLWARVAELPDGSCVMYIGGVSRKAKKAFEKNLHKIAEQLKKECGAREDEAPIELKDENAALSSAALSENSVSGGKVCDEQASLLSSAGADHV